MIEHRLIEKMLSVFNKEIKKIRESKTVDPVIIDSFIDFIRVYADRTHHGKEEDILFKELENKDLNAEDKKIMQELEDEHTISRKNVKELIEAKRKFSEGDLKSADVIADKLSFLVEFYPVHIKKEDEVFFPATEKYFSKDELDKMLNDFWEFDKKMIHEKYNQLYESLSKN